MHFALYLESAQMNLLEKEEMLKNFIANRPSK